MNAHAFIRKTGGIVIPGAALGVGLLGDNLFGQALDFFNPLGDAQSGTDLMDRSIVPSIFRFIDSHLMGPGPKPSKPTPPEPKPKIEIKICDDRGNCQVQ